MKKDPLFISVDLFSGFGGTTQGFFMAVLYFFGRLFGIVKVIACVNHDKKAIKSHWLNHKDVKHFEEDIRTLDLTELISLVAFYRKKYPNAKLILWASLECTNFSKAKGGQPRDADSRTLADHLPRYVKALDPDYIQIENVVEFMSWGPLDENGKPVSRKNGEDWMRWRKVICAHGYTDEWRELNSANFGAYTSRNRLFGIFAKPGLPIVWPEPTHAKHPGKSNMFSNLEKWKEVKDALNLEDIGKSIFTRKKPLSEKSLQRIYVGLVKAIANGDTAYLTHYYGSGGQFSSIHNPAPVIPTKARTALINTIAFILNPSHGGHVTLSHNPCPVIVARQDKAPLYLVQCSTGQMQIEIYEGDSTTMIKIKQFMVAHQIADIKMRMLQVKELLKIQGFPEDYQMVGNQADHKKFIGNSVVPLVVKAMTEALGLKILETEQKQVA